MRTRSFIGIFIGSLAIALVATGSGQAFDKTEVKCRATIAKGFAKANATAEKVLIGCHAGKAKGKVGAGVDCNDLSAAGVDSKGKFAKATGKLTSGVGKKCPASMGDSLLTNYLGCPEPCGTSTGVGPGIDSYTEMGSCLACLAGDMAEANVAGLLGSPSSLDKRQSKCHAAIGKGYTKLVATMAKERTKCQAGKDKLKAGHDHDTSACASYDGKGKIAGALGKAGSGVDKKCTADHLAAIDSCSTESTATLKTCLGSQATSAGEGLYETAYGLGALVCPTGLRSVIQAGPGTNTRLDAGWTGLGHEVSITHQYGFTVGVSCQNSVPPCGDCTITGVDAAASAQLVRCEGDPTQECTNLFADDPVCPDGGRCLAYLGPPLPLSSGGNPVCILNRMVSDITGMANAETGAGSITPDMLSQTHLGEELAQPCPLCVGDVTKADGVANGTCDMGPNQGGACDVHGLHPTFGSSVARGLSLDCPPSSLKNISGMGLVISLPLTTGESVLGFDNKCDAPLNTYDCACGVCTGDAQMPCRDDTECGDVNAGTCTSAGIGQARMPNGCQIDGVCTEVAGSNGTRGECNQAPDEKYCDGQLRANGNGYISCNTDADCIAVGEACDSGDCGLCTMQSRRLCFLNPIKAVGTPDTERPTLAGTFCVPPVANTAINGAAGLPGPGRVMITMDAIRLY